MALLTNLKHYKDIVWLLYKYGDIEILKNFDAQINIQQILNERGHQKGKAQDLVKDLEELGPFYIKLGQILSAELDLLPQEYDEALQNLQDKAQPMPYEDVELVFLEEFKDYPDKIFKKFSREPVSAASLGQVHLAELPQGKKVAVKVQRRNIQTDIFELLKALEQISLFLEEKTELGKRFHIIEKFENLRTILLNELDYLKEADNLIRLSENLKEFENLIVPLPYEKYTTPRILTMEYIKGEKITELAKTKKMNVNGPKLALELLQGFFKQILIDGFFQMDPHPGNIYLTFVNRSPALTILDLGMVAYIPFEIQGKLIQCLFALSEGREIEVGNNLIYVGTKLPVFDEYFFRSKIAQIIGEFRGKSLSKVPMGKVIINLSKIAAESGLWVPIQFTLMGKAFVSLTSVLKSLDSELDPSQVLKEQAFELASQRFSQQFTYQSFYGTYLEGIEFLQKLPRKLNQILDFILKNDYQLKVHFHEHEPIAKNFEKIANRITMGIILASFVIAAALLMRVETSFNILGYPGLPFFLLSLAGVGSLILILNTLWNDKK